MTCSLFAVRCTQPSAEDEANKRASIIKEQLEQAGNLIASGDAEQATHILETLNQNYPGETDILENLAFAYSNQNAYDEAAFYFDQVAALDKDTHLILYAAQAHENAGNTALAQERYMRYLEKNPEDTLAWKRSLQLALAAQNKQYALDAQLAIIKHENRAASAEEALALGDLFSALGNRAQALDWYQEAFKQAKSEEAAAKRLVQLYAETSNWETASDYLTQLEKKKSSELGSLKDSEALAGIQQWREEQAEIERKAREAEETARLAEEEAIRAAEIAELKANPPPPTAVLSPNVWQRMASSCPSTRIMGLSSSTCLRAVSSPKRTWLLLKMDVSGELTYLASRVGSSFGVMPSRVRAVKAMMRPWTSRMGIIKRPRNRGFMRALSACCLFA